MKKVSYICVGVCCVMAILSAVLHSAAYTVYFCLFAIFNYVMGGL